MRIPRFLVVMFPIPNQVQAAFVFPALVPILILIQEKLNISGQDLESGYTKMALKNYTTRVPADRSVQEIQTMLQKHGASGVLTEYEKNTGRIAGLAFQMEIGEQKVGFKLPLNWRAAKEVMKKEGNSRAYDDDYCYRVAWRILRDWVDVQMALVEIEMAQMQQIFLPYLVQKGGKTLYENILENPQFLLEE